MLSKQECVQERSIDEYSSQEESISDDCDEGVDEEQRSACIGAWCEEFRTNNGLQQSDTILLQEQDDYGENCIVIQQPREIEFLLNTVILRNQLPLPGSPGKVEDSALEALLTTEPISPMILEEKSASDIATSQESVGSGERRRRILSIHI